MRNRRRETITFSLFSFQDIITSVMGIVILILLVTALELATRQLDSPVAQHALVRKDVESAIAVARERLARVKQALLAGSWDDLARLSAGDIDRESVALQQLIEILERDLAATSRRLEQAHERHGKAARQFAARGPDEERLKGLQREIAELQREFGRITSASALFYRPGETGGRRAWMVEVSGEHILAAPLGPKQPANAFAGTSPNSRRQQFLAWAQARNPATEYFVLLIKPGGVVTSKEIMEELRERKFGVGLDLIAAEQTAVDPERGAPLVANENGGPR